MRPEEQGQIGEDYIFNELIKRYWGEDYLVLESHQLFELDFIVCKIEDRKLFVKEIYEIKTTRHQNSNRFKAGSWRQLAIFDLQKKRFGTNIPYYLVVLRMNEKGENIIQEELYFKEDVDVDIEAREWFIPDYAKTIPKGIKQFKEFFPR